MNVGGHGLLFVNKQASPRTYYHVPYLYVFAFYLCFCVRQSLACPRRSIFLDTLQCPANIPNPFPASLSSAEVLSRVSTQSQGCNWYGLHFLKSKSKPGQTDSIAAVRAEGENMRVHRGRAFHLEIQPVRCLFSGEGPLVGRLGVGVFEWLPESFPIKPVLD